MTEPGPASTDAELAEYYDRHRDLTDWSEPLPMPKPGGRRSRSVAALSRDLEDLRRAAG